eukprot:4425125-Alexandrium_andersonii.AAC.1
MLHIARACVSCISAVALLVCVGVVQCHCGWLCVSVRVSLLHPDHAVREGRDRPWEPLGTTNKVHVRQSKRPRAAMQDNA